MLQTESQTHPATLLGLPFSELTTALKHMNQPAFRARQLQHWIYKRFILDPAQMTDMSRPLREKLAIDFKWNQLEQLECRESTDGTKKYLFKLADGETIESVWIPMVKRFTVCVSSQVGCKMGCKFCHTATMGFRRHLTSAEIVAQVIAIRREHPVTNIVFMGMGEPFDNYDNVMSAINVLLDDHAFGLSARKVTVSTSGLVPMIKRYAQEARSQLAISLNGSTNKTRFELMPVNKKYPIEEIIETVDRVYQRDRRRVTFEYILMRDVNDTREDAERIAVLLRGLPCKVNLIPYNDNPFSQFHCPPKERMEAFQQLLLSRGYNTTIRWSRGRDVGAACGQLATESKTG